MSRSDRSVDITTGRSFAAGLASVRARFDACSSTAEVDMRSACVFQPTRVEEKSGVVKRLPPMRLRITMWLWSDVSEMSSIYCCFSGNGFIHIIIIIIIIMLPRLLMSAGIDSPSCLRFCRVVEINPSRSNSVHHEAQGMLFICQFLFSFSELCSLISVFFFRCF